MLTSRGHCTSNSEILESLLELFLDSIITLDLKFLKFFTLPSQTIKAIGQIENLENLQLHPQSLFIPSELAEANRTSASFNLLMMEAQGLKLLQLALPLFQMSIPDLMAGARYPAITYLKVDVVRIRPNVLLSIATALKPSLKFLSLANCVEHTVQLLLPVYETLRETLEGFSVSFTQSLTPIRNLSFSKLRVLAVYWLTDFGLLSQPLFSQSPIEILAIAASSTTLDPLTLDTFSKLPQLKKLVFMEARPDYSPPTTWLKACEARHIKCINVDHSELSLLAVSQIHQLLKFVVHFYL
jgi:hypothetical protein